MVEIKGSKQMGGLQGWQRSGWEQWFGGEMKLDSKHVRGDEAFGCNDVISMHSSLSVFSIHTHTLLFFAAYSHLSFNLLSLSARPYLMRVVNLSRALCRTERKCASANRTCVWCQWHEEPDLLLLRKIEQRRYIFISITMRENMNLICHSSFMFS